MIFFRILLLSFFLPLVGATSAWGNNASASNVSLINRDTSVKDIQVEFDVSWQNAWGNSTNNDALWIFFKYSLDSGTTWSHATLKGSGVNPVGTEDGSPVGGSNFNALDMIIPSDHKGVFVQPAHLGSGTVNFTGMRVTWNYGDDGISNEDVIAATTQIRVFATEMVYLPHAGFYIGDGSAGAQGQFEFGGANASRPGAVTNELGFMFGNAATLWYYNTDTGGSDDVASGTVFMVSESFPKGVNAFYLMKYEITQGQYKDFLNTLTRAQQNIRVATNVSTDAITNIYVMSNTATQTNRNGIKCPASGNGTTNPIVFSVETYAENWAANYLSWMDLAAFLDWSGLRPISELEFEKAARGPRYPVTSEYVWGTTGSLVNCTSISGTENGTETCGTANANASYNNANKTGVTGGVGTGPVRAGIFATASTTDRIETGAGYYGNMELMGNVWERVASLGVPSGRDFSGTHGDGVLTDVSGYEGNATNPDWPGLDTTSVVRGITNALGSGRRGGGWATTTAAELQISNRASGAVADTTRGTDYGGRGARSAPQG